MPIELSNSIFPAITIFISSQSKNILRGCDRNTTVSDSDIYLTLASHSNGNTAIYMQDNYLTAVRFSLFIGLHCDVIGKTS